MVRSGIVQVRVKGSRSFMLMLCLRLILSIGEWRNFLKARDVEAEERKISN